MKNLITEILSIDLKSAEKKDQSNKNEIVMSGFNLVTKLHTNGKKNELSGYFTISSFQ